MVKPPTTKEDKELFERFCKEAQYDPDTDDTIIKITGGITVADNKVERFIDALDALFKKYAEDDSWFFKFN